MVCHAKIQNEVNMSFFAVEKRKIAKVWAHPGADRLDLAQVEGLAFQFVCQRGTQVEGQDVIFFPIDSVLPDDLIEFCGIRNMLAGAQHNRIKTVKLRGELGQGFVMNVDRIKEYLKVDDLPEDLTTALGVTKYEPPILFAGDGANLTPLAGFVYSYDIEGADRHPEVVNALKAEEAVWISEKLEGTNFGISVDSGGKVRVNQHNNTVDPKPDALEDHTFIAASKKLGLETSVVKIQVSEFPGKNVTIRGELIGPGIQKNIYKLKDHKVRIFEIEVNGNPVDVDEMLRIVSTEEHLEVVPTVFRGKLEDFLIGRTIQEASNGKSLLNPEQAREGIVIKPLHEKSGEFHKIKQDGTLIKERGRLFIKQRSPEYLAKEKE